MKVRTIRGMVLAAVLLTAPVGSVAAEEVGGQSPPGPATAPVKFGIQTGQEGVTWPELVATWKEAERLGFDSAWLYDHFMPIVADRDEPCLEAWTLLAGLAAHTERIRVGVLVTGNTYRNPALLAKQATTVDHISNGRLDLGIGAAWFEREHQAYGFPFYTARERAERLGESLEVITRLWKEDHPTFEGKRYLLWKAPFAPMPVQKPHPPIVVGGQGKKWILPLVARYADGWNVPIGVSPAGVKERLQLIHEECARIGRQPCDVEVSVFLPLISITKVPLAGPLTRLVSRFVVPSKVGRQLLAGTPQAIVNQIQQYVDVGVGSVILYLRPPFDAQLMRRFAEEVMPAFRR